MIIIKLKGGLGNQLFQYAFGRRISLLNNLPLKLDICTGFTNDFYKRKYSLSHFNVVENIATEEELEDFKRFQSNSVRGKILRLFSTISLYPSANLIQERRNFFYNIKINRKCKKTYFEGYWQNEKYFKDIEEQIRKDFTFRDVSTFIQSPIAIQIAKTNSVGVHVRRLFAKSDDKILESAISKYTILSMDYYSKGIEILKKRFTDLHFFIFSDDPIWVQNNMQFESSTTYIANQSETDGMQDFLLMSLCKHQIIANSTFSWWAAWLNSHPGKVVIAPNVWFCDPKLNVNAINQNSWIQL